MDLRNSAIAFCFLVPALASADPVVRWHCAYAPSEGEVVVCELVRAPVPDTLDGEPIVIPLHSRPVDMARVGILARDVMCGKRPDCEVELAASRNGLAGSSAIATGL